VQPAVLLGVAVRLVAGVHDRPLERGLEPDLDLDVVRTLRDLEAVLVALLAAVLYSTASMWTSIGGGTGMNGNGVAALVLGGIGTLALGGGLMALVFYSSRRGYDDAADFKRDPKDP